MDIRMHAWPFLLGVMAWESTEAERMARTADYVATYRTLKRKWSEMDPEVPLVPEHATRIEKDCIRNDRDHPFFADRPNPAYRGLSPSANDGETTEVWASRIDETHSVQTRKHLEMLRDILCTYSIVDAEVGYVQGMSDIAGLFEHSSDKINCSKQ